MRILIAEDDNISRRLLESILRKLGYEVTACQDGSAAWNAYQEYDYRIVISDWMMPETDGLQLCRMIRRQQRPHYCYFMMLTARASRADSLEAMNAGADDYLTKPLDRNEIEVRLEIAERMIIHQKAESNSPRLYEVGRPKASCA